ncbi:T9SS type B sorting domain-containing protein [Mucilaginibacter ginkgonis]|uniref:Gliding motility-associated C-terminal domain-containing protein n=1 Tax=Mucilaginibacter ginkgonis TaxID=2682091 RepID=A0A6I4ING0_9SPHI|nr:gliding motility-associated C-terminal domain-containing protein [Mucilaginibacter ginkgonis]QQL49477.1 gliding motility-associated C-terminal domain-containing protein [Mucilaginibacter ginkgonis]
MKFTFLLALFATVIGVGVLRAQTCPENIDFSYGNFTNWNCQTGAINQSGIITFTGQGPVGGRQTIITNSDTGKDYYGNFSVVSPSGNKYSIKLGNESAGAQAEQVSYTYTIPADKKDYVFTYYYAVVLQLTNHSEFERPRFSVKLTDLTANEQVQCGTHDFVSGDGLGDFQKSSNGQVEYRDWSTVAVNLGGRAGHKVRFDFTTNDCTYSAHFGYAYLAFDDPCLLNRDPITGSNVCNGSNYVVLTAPPGFGSYNWHLAGNPEILGYGRQLPITPVPPDGTKYAVDVVSTSGVGAGCTASFNATVHKIDEPFIYQLQPNATVCESDGADLTDPKYFTGSSAGLTYKYYVDAAENTAIRNPQKIKTSGRYYVRATNSYGCTDLQFIDINVIPAPSNAPIIADAVCAPLTVDITDPKLISYSPDNTYAFFKDVDLLQPVANPKAVDVAGVYFIKVTNSLGCTSAVPVTVTIVERPKVKPKDITGCSPLDITNIKYNAGDEYAATYKYFKDATATIPLDNANAVTQAGTYYTLGYNSLGCPSLVAAPVKATLTPPATLTLADITPVKYPATVDLSLSVTQLPGYTYNYFADSLATSPLPAYNKITQSGRYFVLATNEYGCTIIKGINVTVNEPDEVNLLIKTAFTPNGDGVNDFATTAMQGAATVNYFKIYSRNGSLVFATKDLGIYWDGKMNGSDLPMGTYYWVCDTYDTFRKKQVIKSGYIALIR